ncbi:GNAT family N-acetyltransferase [Enterococcus sp. BWM-S5]|uniref:GNAT family N-acetyltransferase n=1 Tax=Enterococcus larvae TaxID=2794352 RepID=A0ABS4CI55_9ENTE|nr:GNAT family N-acetyltransferase [Enterococcus larvae]
MKIHYLEETHIDAATALYISVFTKEPWNEEYESKEQVERLIKNFLTQACYLNFIAVEDNEVIGLCLGLKKPWIEGIEYYIDEFCVKTELQGKGIGSAFLAQIEAEILQLGMDGMMLNTEKGVPAEKFYLKNGFHQLSGLIVLGK